MTRPALLALSLVLAGSASAQNPKNMTFATKLKSVAVFRDNFGYYVREGRVKLENGWATTDLVPSAIKGTVRFYTTEGGDKIDQVVIGKENRLDFAGADEIKKRLADKVGLKLIILTNGGQRHEGELARILDDMLLLRIGESFIGVPYGSIRSILLAGFPVRIKVATTDANKVVGIGVAYLQEGIRWEPSYILDMKGATGNLSLRASMQNTTEKIEGSDVFFVVGSPFVANRGIADMLVPTAVSAPSEPAAPKTTNRPPTLVDGFNEAVQTASGAAAVSRDEAGELYYYKKTGLNLATSDVAMVSILDAAVPVAPRFEWNADTEDVSYLVNLVNKTREPLTTGTVFVLEDGKAIGQDTVKYTPAGAATEIRLARGVGLKVQKVESEVKRNPPVKVGRTDYIPVLLKGTLTITNHKTEPATVKVLKTVRGRVDRQSDGGIVKNTQILSGEPNPINDLEWTVTVPAGATKTLTYTFETYMAAERAGSPPVPTGNGNGDDRR